MSYTLIDGGANDEDGTANGTIVDPVGLGTGSLAITGKDIAETAFTSLILLGLGLILAKKRKLINYTK